MDSNTWSETKSIFYTIKHDWTIEGFHYLTKLAEYDTFPNYDPANDALKALAHPCLHSVDLYSEQRPLIRFTLEFYPRGRDLQTEKTVQIFLNYKPCGGPERVKVFMCVQPSEKLFLGELESGGRLGGTLMEHGNVKNFVTGFGIDSLSLKIELRVFMGTDFTVSTSYLPVGQNAQQEAHARETVQRDLIKYLDRETDNHVSVKRILTSGHKALLAAVLPWHSAQIAHNFDEFFESYLSTIATTDELNKLMKFLYTGSDAKLGLSIDAREKLSTDVLKLQIERSNQTHVYNDVLPKGAQQFGPLIGSECRVSKRFRACDLPEQKAPKPSAYKEFSLTHVWQVDCLATDPDKKIDIHSDKFYSQAYPGIKFSLQMHQHACGYHQEGERKIPKKMCTLNLKVQMEGFDELEVQFQATAKTTDNVTLVNGAWPVGRQELVKGYGSISLTNFLKYTPLHFDRSRSQMRLKAFRYQNADSVTPLEDSLSIECKIKVNIINPPLEKANVFCAKLVDNLGTLLASGGCSDTELVVSGGERLAAHRAVLCARSERFKDRYAAQRDVASLSFPEQSADVMKDVLRFMYTGKCPPKARITVPLYEAAHTFKLSALKEHCSVALADTFTVNNVGGMLELSVRMQDRSLMNACFDYRMDHLECMEESGDTHWERTLRSDTRFITEYAKYVAKKSMYFKAKKPTLDGDF